MQHEADATSNLFLDAPNWHEHVSTLISAACKSCSLLGIQPVHHLPHRQGRQHVRQLARHLQLDKLILHIVSEFLWHKVEFGL